MQARFDDPWGIVVMEDGTRYVADAGDSNRIRRIDSDAAHTVLTIAGNGLLGLRDGAGSQAMFRRPDGIAIDADGATTYTQVGPVRSLAELTGLVADHLGVQL